LFRDTCAVTCFKGLVHPAPKLIGIGITTTSSTRLLIWIVKEQLCMRNAVSHYIVELIPLSRDNLLI